MKKPPIVQRSEHWYLRRRVPTRYKSVESRREVLLSLHTDSRAESLAKWPSVWESLVAGWEAKLAGNEDDATKRHAAAVELAAVRGFRYLPTREVLDLPVEQRLERIEAARDRPEAAALLGVVGRPTLTVREALKEYWGLTKDKIVGKSDNQVRLWENPRKRAVENFVAAVEDKPIAEIDRDDMLEFRQAWLERIASGEVQAATANKDFVHLADVLKTVNRLKRLGLDLPPILSELNFKKGEARTRPPFSREWIKQKLLAPGALSGLNTEARCLILGMVNTGYRPSEGAMLTASTIHLSADVPHISIEPDGRTLKSQYARRKIPLLGVSLEAFKECPSGFPRYFDKAGLSGTVNKFLRENGLMETEQHTLYSLRHSFEDRMLEAGIDERIRRDLFGHTLNRERYGKGADLAHAAKLLRPVAL